MNRLEGPVEGGGRVIAVPQGHMEDLLPCPQVRRRPGHAVVPRFWGEIGPRVGELIPLMDPETPGLPRLGPGPIHSQNRAAIRPRSAFAAPGWRWAAARSRRTPPRWRRAPSTRRPPPESAPSLAKQDGVKLKAFPRIRFKFVLKGDTEMEYQIVKREAFRIVGFRTPLPMDVEEGFQVVPRFWGEIGPRVGELIPLGPHGGPSPLPAGPPPPGSCAAGGCTPSKARRPGRKTSAESGRLNSQPAAPAPPA